MDIARPVDRRRKRLRQGGWTLLALLGLAALSVGPSKLKEAAPSVDAATVWIDTVRRGPMLREVHGIGTLVPEDIRWIPASSDGRVERIVLRPGTAVSPDSVVLELTKPQLDQALEDARRRASAAR